MTNLSSCIKTFQNIYVTTLYPILCFLPQYGSIFLLISIGCCTFEDPESIHILLILWSFYCLVSSERIVLYLTYQLIHFCFSLYYLPQTILHWLIGSQLSSSNLLLHLVFICNKPLFSFYHSKLNLCLFSSNTVVLISTPGLYLCCSLCWNVNKYLLSKIIKNMAFWSQEQLGWALILSLQSVTLH